MLSCTLLWAETMRMLPQLAPLLHGGAGAEQHNQQAQHCCQIQSHRQSHTLVIRDTSRSILTGVITCRSPSMSPPYCRHHPSLCTITNLSISCWYSQRTGQSVMQCDHSTEVSSPPPTTTMPPLPLSYSLCSPVQGPTWQGKICI